MADSWAGIAGFRSFGGTGGWAMWQWTSSAASESSAVARIVQPSRVLERKTCSAPNTSSSSSDKIGWTVPVPPDQIVLFLRDFYTAERAFLEREQLYGKGRADKYAQPAPGG